MYTNNRKERLHKEQCTPQIKLNEQIWDTVRPLSLSEYYAQNSDQRTHYEIGLAQKITQDPSALVEFHVWLNDEIQKSPSHQKLAEKMKYNICNALYTAPHEETNILIENPDLLTSHFDIAKKNVPLEEIIKQKYPREKVNSSIITGIEKTSETILRRTVENIQTQGEIVEFMYQSVLHFLRKRDDRNAHFATRLLSMQTPFLRKQDIQTGWFIAAELCSDPEIFFKYYWLNAATGALRDLKYVDGEALSNMYNAIMDRNPGWDEMVRDRKKILPEDLMQKKS
jgi:hypothetical protein